MFTTAILSALLSPLVVTDAPKSKTFPTPVGASAEAKDILAAVVQVASQDAGNSTGRAQLLTNACKQALAKLHPQSLAGELLSTALKAPIAAGSDSTATALLAKAAAEVHAMLAFEPLREADLPEGVPTYTRVGTIEVKQYPEYRKAQARQFFTLFRHIQRNNIAMTAPVQMEFQPATSGGLAQQSMAFLYGSMELGETGEQGAVTVMDVQPTTVVSAGVRGRRKPQVLSDTVSRLQNWIAANPQYERAGPVRVMGYSSPFVPASKQYFEVQIPIQKQATAPGRAEN